MGLLYAIFSIFITLIFPKQITDVICYGRHRDRENIKSKKIYCLIYVFLDIIFWFVLSYDRFGIRSK